MHLLRPFLSFSVFFSSEDKKRKRLKPGEYVSLAFFCSCIFNVNLSFSLFFLLGSALFCLHSERFSRIDCWLLGWCI